jgi:cupin 2 domain-containing protein
MVKSGNLFAKLPTSSAEEEFTNLLTLPGARVERIVSTGQASPEGYWYDYVEIPPHVRHRVEWTDAGAPTVWLAVHGA